MRSFGIAARHGKEEKHTEEYPREGVEAHTKVHMMSLGPCSGLGMSDGGYLEFIVNRVDTHHQTRK